MSPEDALNEAEARTLLAWRAALVRWTAGAMVVAVVLFFVTFALRLPAWVEYGLAGTLLIAVVGVLRAARAGRCPRCGTRLPIVPRILVPVRCPACGVALHRRAGEAAGPSRD